MGARPAKLQLEDDGDDPVVVLLPAIWEMKVDGEEILISIDLNMKQSGAVEACWAHNPEVRRSKLRSAMLQHKKSSSGDSV